MSRLRQANVLYRVFVLGQLTHALLEREFGKLGLRANDFGLLSAIGVAGGGLTPSQLATRTGMPPTTLSSSLRRLEESGLVRRRANPSDGRSSIVELTARGRANVQRGAPALRAALAAVHADLDAPLEEVIGALDALESALRQALATERPRTAARPRAS